MLIPSKCTPIYLHLPASDIQTLLQKPPDFKSKHFSCNEHFRTILITEKDFQTIYYLGFNNSPTSILEKEITYKPGIKDGCFQFDVLYSRLALENAVTKPLDWNIFRCMYVRKFHMHYIAGVV